MDRRTSFSSSHDISRSVSFNRPQESLNSERTGTSTSSIFSQPSGSNTSSLGRVGLLKYQREALRQQLLQQYLINNKQGESVSALRKLALRLSIQISVREARLKDHAAALSRSRLTQYLSERQKDDNVKELLGVLKDYERQAEDIIRTLDERSGPSKSGLQLTLYC
jgi:hypothetical protein